MLPDIAIKDIDDVTQNNMDPSLKHLEQCNSI